MLIEMECTCGARVNIDSEDDYSDASWVLGIRFASAHEKCGFVTPPFMSSENNPNMQGHTPEEDEE
jgi:hypothetical protein